MGLLKHLIGSLLGTNVQVECWIDRGEDKVHQYTDRVVAGPFILSQATGVDDKKVFSESWKDAEQNMRKFVLPIDK